MKCFAKLRLAMASFASKRLAQAVGDLVAVIARM